MRNAFKYRALAAPLVAAALTPGQASAAVAGTVTGTMSRTQYGIAVTGWTVARVDAVTSYYQNITLACGAVARYAVSSTGVGCFVKGLNDSAGYCYLPNTWIPGNVTMTSTPQTRSPLPCSMPIQPYMVCVAVGFVDLQGRQSGNSTSYWIDGAECFT